MKFWIALGLVGSFTAAHATSSFYMMVCANETEVDMDSTTVDDIRNGYILPGDDIRTYSDGSKEVLVDWSDGSKDSKIKNCFNYQDTNDQRECLITREYDPNLNCNKKKGWRVNDSTGNGVLAKQILCSSSNEPTDNGMDAWETMCGITCSDVYSESECDYASYSNTEFVLDTAVCAGECKTLCFAR